MSDKRYYVRVRGKVLGPFTLAQLGKMRDRGQFAKFHEVSEDRKTWQPASALSDLFHTVPAAEAPVNVATPSAGKMEPISETSRPDAGWFVSRDEQMLGPHTFQVLQREAATGRLTPTDVVWHESFTSWVPAQQVSGLTFAKHAVRPRSRKVLLAGSVAAVVVLGTLPLLYFFILRPWLWPVDVTYLSSHASAEEITQAYRPKVYLVQSAAGTGSGLLLARDQSRGLIVTNHHVLAPDQDRVAELLREKVNVKNPSQLDYRPAQVVALHRRLDLALLLIEMEPGPPAAVPVLRKKTLRQGEEAVALGNPLGLPFFTSSGLISSTSSAGGFIWTTCPVSKGNSGGPLFLKRRGLLVGINTLKLGDLGMGVENLNASIPAEEVPVSLQGPQQDSWSWNESHKDRVLALAKLVPLEE